MKLYQNMIAYGSIIAAGLLGCNETQQKETPKELPKYFASVPMTYDSGNALTNGDFDGDGDLDLIVITESIDSTESKGKLYLFLNDGKGNFTLKKPNQ